MRSFEDLAAEAVAADVTGWGFGWLDGRATEERPPWGYARLLAARLARVGSALDVGEVVAEAPVLPPRMVVTEGWRPNARRAWALLGPRGVEVVEPGAGVRLPDASFDLVTARHPVAPDWPEIHRVLRAVIWVLRKCVWWVPDFSVERYEGTLRALDAEMRAGRPVVAHATRHLIEARRPPVD